MSDLAADQTVGLDVLVVDDEPLVVEQVLECLRHAGISSASCPSVANALGKIEQGLRPEIVLSALRMPEMDGFALASGLRDVSAATRPELIFLSGDATLETAIDAMRLGARDLLTEPVDRDKLLHAINSVLTTRRSATDRSRLGAGTIRPGASNAGLCSDAELREGALKALRQVRDLRVRYLPDELFSDPCWEMLLDVYRSHLASTPVAVAELVMGSGAPTATANRRIEEMEEHGLLERLRESPDSQKSYVTLTEIGLLALDSFFDAYLSHFSGRVSSPGQSVWPAPLLR